MAYRKASRWGDLPSWAGLRAVAERAAQLEREACAQIAEDANNRPEHITLAPEDATIPCGYCVALETIATEIRARGEGEK